MSAVLCANVQVTVVLKHMFDPDDAAKGGATFVSELEADVLSECSNLGAVDKVSRVLVSCLCGHGQTCPVLQEACGWRCPTFEAPA